MTNPDKYLYLVCTRAEGRWFEAGKVYKADNVNTSQTYEFLDEEGDNWHVSTLNFDTAQEAVEHFSGGVYDYDFEYVSPYSINAVECIGYNAGERYFSVGTIYPVCDGRIVSDNGHEYKPSASELDVIGWLSYWYKFRYIIDNPNTTEPEDIENDEFLGFLFSE